ncbi:hypothetical protein V5T82_11525 [Magnetovibrio sp. PR-2]|uniref:hypothetical protein n=1 Tax=Magnetovibrio sp. PR-2 TaxID=3120356 RepID=UPI002FCDEFEF
MKRTGRKQEWSLTLFMFGVVMFLPPVIGIYNHSVLVLGLPVTYLVLFGVWAFIIVAIFIGARPSPLRKDGAASGQAMEPTFPDTDARRRS